MTTRDNNGRPTPYNGWSNYETWNVAQWLTAQPDLYDLCRRHSNSANTYADVAFELNQRGITSTPDGVLFWSETINTTELDAMLRELS
jgi:hypothetical protein